MSANETKKQPPLLGLLWPHEIPLLALIGWAFYKASPEFRGSPMPVIFFGCAMAAGVVMLALRCADEWRVLPNKFFFFSVAAVWVAMFIFLGNSTFGYLDSNSIFYWAFDIYTSPDSDAQYGLFIPFVVLVLLWWKRKELVASPLGLWWPGVLIVAAGLLAHLVGYVVQQPRLSFIGFFIGLYGLTGLAWGKNWLKASFFPYFLLAFCIPAFGTDAFTLRLRLLVTWIVAAIAHLGLSPDLIRDGTQLFDAQHTFGYEVAAACSGIRSLVALLALTTIYGFVVFKSPWKRAVMILSAVPLAVLGNVVRLCFTIGVAELFGQGAGNAVEHKFGFITFAVAIGCVYFLSRWMEKNELQPAPPTGAINS
ncbi:MAG TPA: exosortase/archaeosortase family protein [Verrucomicrobiae bacterium]